MKKRSKRATVGVKTLVKQIRRDLTKLEAKAKAGSRKKVVRRKKATKRRAKRRTRR